jgi:hypothetical protein
MEKIHGHKYSVSPDDYLPDILSEYLKHIDEELDSCTNFDSGGPDTMLILHFTSNSADWREAKKICGLLADFMENEELFLEFAANYSRHF